MGKDTVKKHKALKGILIVLSFIVIEGIDEAFYGKDSTEKKILRSKTKSAYAIRLTIIICSKMSRKSQRNAGIFLFDRAFAGVLIRFLPLYNLLCPLFRTCSMIE